MKSVDLSIVLPCYNEAKSIPFLLKRFAEVIGKRNAELIIVNNGSYDNTVEVLEKELKNPKYKFARVVTVKRNKGYGYGILFGLKSCKGDVLAYTHADQQCDPFDVMRAYDELVRYPDMKRVLVKGKRTIRVLRELVITKGLHIIAAALFFRKFDDINGQPKVFHKSFLEKLAQAPHDFKFDFYVQYMAMKSEMKIKSIQVKWGQRKHGESHWAYSMVSKIKTYWDFFKYLAKLSIVDLFK